MTFQHIKRYFREPRQSFFLFGPRGTGKSTLIRRRFPEALIIDLLASDTRRQFAGHPERLLEIVRAQPHGKVIVIDEIQKVPELLSNVHLLIEEQKEWLFVLTGSSARKLRKEGVDLLGYYLPPFAYAEMQVLGDAVKGAGTLDDEKLTAYLHAHSFHTILGDIRFGADGDWLESKIVFEQFHDVKGNDVDQFRGGK